MRIVDPTRIASITYLSQQPINAPLGLDAIASKLKVNHGLAEEVIDARSPTSSWPAPSPPRRRQPCCAGSATPSSPSSPRTLSTTCAPTSARWAQLTGEHGAGRTGDRRFRHAPRRTAGADPARRKARSSPTSASTTTSPATTRSTPKSSMPAAIARSARRSAFPAIATCRSNRCCIDPSPPSISTATPWTNPPSMSTMALGHPALRAMLARHAAGHDPRALHHLRRAQRARRRRNPGRSAQGAGK